MTLEQRVEVMEKEIAEMKEAALNQTANLEKAANNAAACLEKITRQTLSIDNGQVFINPAKISASV